MKKIYKEVECKSPAKIHPCDTCNNFSYITKKFKGKLLIPELDIDLYDSEGNDIAVYTTKFPDGTVTVFLEQSIIEITEGYNHDLCTLAAIVDGPSEDKIIKEIKEKYFTNTNVECKIEKLEC